MKPYLYVSALLTASCGYAAPYRASGPVAEQGVQVTLLGDRCYVNRSAAQFPTAVDDDRLHVDVNLQLANVAAQSARVSLAEFALVEGTPPTGVVLLPREADVVTLSPGETRTVGLAFEKEAAIDCRRDFTIDAKSAVAIGGKHVHLAALRFQPIQ